MHLLWLLLDASTHLFVFCHRRAHPVQISLHCSDLLVVRDVHEPKLLVLQCSDEFFSIKSIAANTSHSKHPIRDPKHLSGMIPLRD